MTCAEQHALMRQRRSSSVVVPGCNTLNTAAARAECHWQKCWRRCCRVQQVLTVEAWEALTLQEQQVTWAGLYAVRLIDSNNQGGPAVTQLPLNVSAQAGLKHFLGG